jgi:hypothetical protein
MLYTDFIKSSTVSHNDSIDTYLDGLKYLKESKSDIVSYNTQTNLSLFNVPVLEVDKNGDSIYEYSSFGKRIDIIDNIHIVSSNSNVKMKFIIGDDEYENINTFLCVLAYRSAFKIKLIITEPKFDDKISICYRNYLLNNDLRKELSMKEFIKTDTHQYKSGMCQKL